MTAPAVQAAEQSTLYVIGPQAAQRCPEPQSGETQSLYEGRVRLSCDIDWKAATQAGTAIQTYASFIGGCAKACAPHLPESAADQVPQLTQLGSQAADESSAASASTTTVGVGASAALVSALAIGGAAAATGAALALAKSGPGPDDPPASP